MMLLNSIIHNATYTRTTQISMNRVRTLKYSLKDGVFAVLAALSFLLICLFPWWSIQVPRIVYKYEDYKKYFSKVMNINE